MTNKKISIIIPIFNREKYLDRCLKSVLEQKNVTAEIILIDDGSTDNSFEVCKKYESNHSNIKVIHTENHGVGHARNKGLDIASGDYIAFLDSDDVFAPNALFDLQNALEENDVDLVIGKMDCVTSKGEFIKSIITAC